MEVTSSDVFHTKRKNLETYRAVHKRDWLPELAHWPELVDLRRRHLALLDAADAVAHELAQLESAFEQEDAHRAEALKSAYLDGTGEAALPEATTPEHREAARAPLLERSAAIMDALEEFVGRTLATLASKREEWFGELAQVDAAAEAKRREARRLLHDADREAAEVARARTWLDRNSGGRLGPVHWDALAAPPSDRLPDLDQIRDRQARNLDAAPGIEVLT